MKTETRTFPARVELLADVTAFVEARASEFGLDDTARFGVLLALEEAFVNVCSYAYPEGDGEADVRCGREGDVFVLDVADRGTPFDVLSLPEPDTTADIAERKVGGLGVHFIRHFTNSVSYRRENDRNVLHMTFRPAPAEQAGHWTNTPV